MLEAKDYDSVDMVSPFLGSIIDYCCGTAYHAPVTKAFTMYVDMVAFITRRFRTPGWTEDELTELDYDIKAFKSHSCSVFSSYQASGMGTSKWHSLDHVVESLRHVGGIEYLHGGLYEHAHKRFKDAYKLTSRRKRSAMEETLRRQLEIASNSTKCLSSLSTVLRPNACRIESVRNDSTYLIRHGPYISLRELEGALHHLYERKLYGKSQVLVNPKTLLLGEGVGTDALKVLIRLLKRRLLPDIDKPSSELISKLRDRKIQVPSSAFVAGHYTPSLDCPVYNSSVLIERKNKRISQRVVSCASFYGSHRERFDSVMIENGDASSARCSTKNISVWFAQVLMFLRMVRDDEGTRKCQLHKRRSCPVCHHHAEDEWCFVRYYQVLDSTLLPLDGVDEVLRCHRLRWHRDGGVVGELSAAPEYGLVPADSIRGIVHVVRADFPLPCLASSDERRSNCDKIREGEEGMMSKLFYINRFYKCRGEEYDWEED